MIDLTYAAIAASSFFLGAGVVGLAGYRLYSIDKQDKEANPLVSPPNQHARRVRDAAESQLWQWMQSGYNLDQESPETGIQVLRFIQDWSTGKLSVWTVEHGVLTLPNGGSIPIRRFAEHLEQVLIGAYKALDQAAGLIVDYSATLPPGRLQEKGQPLYCRKCAFEPELVELARLLDLDPDSNVHAQFGRADLWERLKAADAQARRPNDFEYGYLIAALRAARIGQDPKLGAEVLGSEGLLYLDCSEFSKEDKQMLEQINEHQSMRLQGVEPVQWPELQPS